MSMKQILESAVQNVPEEFKAELQAQLDEVNKQLEEFQKKANTIIEGVNADPNSAMRAALLYNDIVTKISENVKATLDKVQKEAEKKQEAENAQNNEGAQGGQGAGEASEASNSEDKTKKETHDEITNSMSTVCEALKKAMQGGFGTDYDGVDSTGAPTGIHSILSNDQIINENNIIELFERWEKQCAHTGDFNDDKDGLIESLMDDCEGDQKEEIAGIIINLLEKRAKQYNLDVDNLVLAARKAAGGSRHWYTLGIRTRDDDAIQKSVKALYDAVKKASDKDIKDSEAKDKADKAAEKKKAEDKKAEDEAKKADKEKETINLFISDMREIWKDEKLEKSDKVRYENGKFRIRIEGKEYSGVDFNALVKAVKDAGYNPKEYLSKKA